MNESSQFHAADTKVLIASVTARGSLSATGQLVDTLFDWLGPIETLSLHTGHEPEDDSEPQLLFRRTRVFSLLRKIRHFSPDVIYVRPTLRVMTFNFFVLLVILVFQPKVVVHIMDDEVTDLTNGGAIKRRLFSAYLLWLFRRADQLFTISPGMSRAFEERYGRGSWPLANFPNPQSLQNIPREIKRSEIRIGYFGSLDIRMNQRCVTEVCEAVEALNWQGYSVSVDIYTRPVYRMWAEKYFRFEHSQVHDYVPSDAYLSTLTQYDAVLIGYNFDQTSIQYCRYSIANKLADYINAGCPVLIVGPEEVETVALCKQYEIGTTLSAGYASLEQDLARYLVQKESLRTLNANNGIRYREALQLDGSLDAWANAFARAD